MIKKYTMLNYIPETLYKEAGVNPARVFNNKVITQPAACVITRNFRFEDNFVLKFAQNNEHIVIFLKPVFEIKGKQEFFDRNFNLMLKKFKNYRVFTSQAEVDDFITDNKIQTIIRDFNPLLQPQEECIEVDGLNIVPARFVSHHKEYNAQTLRRKIYFHISEFLTDFEEAPDNEGFKVLQEFIETKLDKYAEYRNNEYVTSRLSRYFNWGFLSPQRAAIEVLKSDTDSVNKESFLEELIVRRELSSNFCLYAKNYKGFDDIPDWALMSLRAHGSDLRIHNYSREEFENAQTADENWNKIQQSLVNTGSIHPYLRMFWAKKILEWSPEPEEALRTAIYLNDKYAYDAPSENGYTAILWSIGGLHDRAFRDMPVTGKIRRMGEKKIKNML